MQIEEVRQKLGKYRALDSDLRLRAYLAINERPAISFNELSRKVKVERGLLAYHLGVLKAVGLVDVTYERTGKETSKYELTDEGRQFLRQLSAGSRSVKRKAESLVH